MNTFNNFNNNFDKFYDYIGHNFVNLLLGFHIIYFLVVFGLITYGLEYINIIYKIVHTILCLFLVIRFSPLREKHELRANDPKMIFSISSFLILNMIVVELVKRIYPSKYEIVKKHMNK
jgi:hypothetical protein